MTIVVTIHQPSSQVFEMFDLFCCLSFLYYAFMFDKICLMAAGRLAFLGTVDQAIHFIGEQGYPLPENFNPADHLIGTLSVHDHMRRPKSKTRAKVLYFVQNLLLWNFRKFVMHFWVNLSVDHYMKSLGMTKLPLAPRIPRSPYWLGR